LQSYSVLFIFTTTTIRFIIAFINKQFQFTFSQPSCLIHHSISSIGQQLKRPRTKTTSIVIIIIIIIIRILIIIVPSKQFLFQKSSFILIVLLNSKTLLSCERENIIIIKKKVKMQKKKHIFIRKQKAKSSLALHVSRIYLLFHWHLHVCFVRLCVYTEKKTPYKKKIIMSLYTYLLKILNEDE